ncbi:MAG: helix-turn-helix transcriptional regulator, partial [Agrobacterium sp.]|nr:helix-turn-helix transcriptional regulator [Agrobacterium sp.]
LTNLSQSHFSHAFKASTGVPPHQWQMQARIDRVNDLMMRTDMALTDIAIASGFSDQAHFSRVFRKMVGVSPSVWQKIRQ